MTLGMSLEIENSQNPVTLFSDWFNVAIKGGQIEPNAMTLATSVGNEVRARIVLLKKHSEDGFYFFTNYQSQKGKDLIANPQAALCFHWRLTHHRQVRIIGTCE